MTDEDVSPTVASRPESRALRRRLDAEARLVDLTRRSGAASRTCRELVLGLDEELTGHLKGLRRDGVLHAAVRAEFSIDLGPEPPPQSEPGPLLLRVAGRSACLFVHSHVFGGAWLREHRRTFRQYLHPIGLAVYVRERGEALVMELTNDLCPTNAPVDPVLRRHLGRAL